MDKKGNGLTIGFFFFEKQLKDFNHDKSVVHRVNRETANNVGCYLFN